MMAGVINRLSYAILGIAAVLVFVAGFFWVFSLLGFRFNASNSLPPGLYWHTGERGHWKRGQIVALCPPNTSFLHQLKQHNQLYRGDCPGGYMVWMKPIVAIAGDSVDVSSQGVSVNGQRIRNSERLKRTLTGLNLPQIDGHYRVQPGTVWLISDYNPKSIDSRYLGAVSIQQLQTQVKPILIFP